MFREITSRKIYLLQNTNIINCFNVSDWRDVESNPLVGMLAILKYNESVFQPYQFAETVICCI